MCYLVMINLFSCLDRACNLCKLSYERRILQRLCRYLSEVLNNSFSILTGERQKYLSVWKSDQFIL